jgi:hypothetical protein
LLGVCAAVRADLVPTPDGIAVKQADVATPARGMSMAQVAGKFGEPVNKVAAVGVPPISRWEYSGFVVYFERDHVIHTVVGGTVAATPEAPAAAPATSASSPRPSAPAAETPAGETPAAGTPAASTPPPPAS